jgi:hypothetical protein
VFFCIYLQKPNHIKTGDILYNKMEANNRFQNRLDHVTSLMSNPQDGSESSYLVSRYNSLEDLIVTRDTWLVMLTNVKTYMDENLRRPYINDENEYYKQLDKWIIEQVLSYRVGVGVMREPGIKSEWEQFINDPRYSKYILTQREMWVIQLERVKAYINQNLRIPMTADDDKKIGSWVRNQIISYQIEQCMMKRPEIRSIWESFINDPCYMIYFRTYEEQWMDMLSKVKRYMDKKLRIPTQRDRNPVLGHWLALQNFNYKNNKSTMKETLFRTSWEEFVHDPRYSSVSILI